MKGHPRSEDITSLKALADNIHEQMGKINALIIP